MSHSAADTDIRDLFGAPQSALAKGRQLPLPLGWRGTAAVAAQPMIIGDSNRAAIAHVMGHAHWSMPASLLIGPPQSGRSLLGTLFLSSGGAMVIDRLTDAEEEGVFHSWNRALARGEKMLIIADSADSLAMVALPDLRTRLATAPLVEIGAPDACLTRDLIEHLLVQRGLQPAEQLGSYVAARIERSYGAIHRAVEAIDAEALASGTGAGIRTARAALLAAGLYGEAASDTDSTETA